MGSGNGIRKNKRLINIAEQRLGKKMKIPKNTEEAAVGGIVLSVRGDHAGDRLLLSLAVRVRVDNDLQRIKDRAVLNIFERNGAASGVDVHAALVKFFAALKFDFHSLNFCFRIQPQIYNLIFNIQNKL